MTSSFTKRKPYSFFYDKKATLIQRQENLGGDIIKANTEVTIIAKSRDLNWCLHIKDEATGIQIRNVDCEYLELIK